MRRLTGYVGTKYSTAYVTTDTMTAAPIQFTQGSFTKSNASLSYYSADGNLDIHSEEPGEQVSAPGIGGVLGLETRAT